jgi:hypothetical protein
MHLHLAPGNRLDAFGATIEVLRCSPHGRHPNDVTVAVKVHTDADVETRELHLGEAMPVAGHPLVLAGATPSDAHFIV